MEIDEIMIEPTLRAEAPPQGPAPSGKKDFSEVIKTIRERFGMVPPIIISATSPTPTSQPSCSKPAKVPSPTPETPPPFGAAETERRDARGKEMIKAARHRDKKMRKRSV